MSKNMTKKGLALGSAAAMVVAGFSAVPANALGLADTTFVSLTPTTGTEYSVLASDTGSGATFSLASNEAVTVSTGDLKFLVTDPNSWVEPTIATEGREVALADETAVATTVGAGATDVVSFTGLAAAVGLSTGDKIYFKDDVQGQDNNAGLNTGKIISKDVIFTVTVTGNNAAITTDVDLADADQVLVDGAETIVVIREARTTTGAYAGTFVIDSGSTNAANVENITLASDSLETRSVTVQAWMDANDDDKIDAVEYASPVRTITWVKSTDLTVSTSITPVAGDATLEASVTTSPVLNGEQTAAFNGGMQ